MEGSDDNRMFGSEKVTYYSRLLVVILASVTLIALIPTPASAVEPKLTVEPSKATFGQTITVFIEYYDMKVHNAELTFSYGSMELERVDVWVNGSFTYSWKVKEQWADDPATGGEGGYSIRLWIDNKTVWGQLWVEKTWTQIGKDNARNTDRLIASNEGLGKLIVAAEYGLFGLFVLLIIISALWVQHRLSKRLRKQSWASRVWLWWQVNIRRVNPASLNRPDPETDAVIKGLDDIYTSIAGDPAKIIMGNVALATKNFIGAVEKAHKRAMQGQGARASQN